MPEISPEIAPQILSACKSNAEKLAAALSETLECKLGFDVGEVDSFDADSPPEGLEGEALAIALTVGDQALLLLLPKDCGFLPEWVSAPGIATQDELEKLALTIGKLILPPGMKVSEARAAVVPNGKESLQLGGVAEQAVHLPLTLAAVEGDSQGRLSLLWPIARPAAVFPQSDPGTTPSANPSDSAASPANKTPEPNGAAAHRNAAADFSRLPNYARTLLKISVPVTVTVARKKQRVQEIVELAPGSIINFNKTCDELLQLEIGEATIADGEVIKVGDKYGLRVKSIVLPPERFASARKAAASQTS